MSRVSRVLVALLPTAVWASPVSWAAAGQIVRAEGDALRVSEVFDDVERPVRIRYRASTGEVFVLSAADHAVSVFDRGGRLVRRVGRIGNGPGELLNPVDFTVTPAGEIWVADRGNERIQAFDATGRYRTQFRFSAPLSIDAIDDRTFVVVGTHDTALARIVDSTGREVGQLSGLIDTGHEDPVAKAYANRGYVRVYRDSIFLVFRSVVEPTVRQYARTGGLQQELRPEGAVLRAVAATARADQWKGAASSSGPLRFVAVLNTVAVHPKTGEVWIVPAGLAVYVYSPAGKKTATFHFEDQDGLALGAHDLVLTPEGRGYLIAMGRGVFEFRIPARPAK